MAELYHFLENYNYESGSISYDHERISGSELEQIINRDFQSTVNQESGQFRWKGRVGFVEEGSMHLFSRALVQEDAENAYMIQLLGLNEEMADRGQLDHQALAAFQLSSSNGFGVVFRYVLEQGGYNYPMYFFHYEDPQGPTKKPVAIIPLFNQTDMKSFVKQFYYKSVDLYQQITGL